MKSDALFLDIIGLVQSSTIEHEYDNMNIIVMGYLLYKILSKHCKKHIIVSKGQGHISKELIKVHIFIVQTFFL